MQPAGFFSIDHATHKLQEPHLSLLNCSPLPGSQTAFYACILLLLDYFHSCALTSGSAGAGLGNQGKLPAGGGTDKSLKWSRWLEGRNEILGEESEGRTSGRGPSLVEVHKKLNRPIGRPKAQILHPPGRSRGGSVSESVLLAGGSICSGTSSSVLARQPPSPPHTRRGGRNPVPGGPGASHRVYVNASPPPAGAQPITLAGRQLNYRCCSAPACVARFPKIIRMASPTSRGHVLPPARASRALL